MHARKTVTTLGALVLSLALAGGANAAPQVEVEYDLSDTLLLNAFQDRTLDNADLVDTSAFLTSSMVVRYQSDSGAGGTPGILAGAATIQSLELHWSGKLGLHRDNSFTGIYASFTDGVFFTTAYDGLELYLIDTAGSACAPSCSVPAQLTASGLLKATGVRFQLQGGVYDQRNDRNFFIQAGDLTGTATISVPGPAAPVSGSGLAPGHTLDGRQGYGGTGTRYSGTFDALSTSFTAGGETVILPREMTLVGREISRTAIPEPGSLLLLGSGLAGLAALGSGSVVGRRRLRRTRHD